MENTLYNLKTGIITYNEFNLDLNLSPHQQIFELQEDLLQIKFPQNYTLDVGWYPSLNPAGCLKIYVIKDYNWINPVYELNTDLQNFLFELQKTIDLVESLVGKT